MQSRRGFTGGIFKFILLSFLLATATSKAAELEDHVTGVLEEDPTNVESLLPEGTSADWTEGKEEQAVGFYNRGKLKNPTSIPLTGEGYRLLHNTPTHNFATYDLVTLISEGAALVKSQYPQGDLMRVGDFSKESGGRFGHHSHQNGLDGDLSYYRKSGREKVDLKTRTFGPSIAYRRDLDVERTFAFVDFIYRTGRISTIFVHGYVKKALCVFARKIGLDVKRDPLLAAIRPYGGHATHMHVRMTCPRNSPRCINEKSYGPKTGC